MADVYPIKDKNTKPFSKTNLVLLIAVIVLAILLFRQCNGNLIPKPVVITGKQVHDTMRLIDAERKRLSDSFNLVISSQEREIRTAKYNYDNLLADYIDIQNGLTETFANAKYPDTCKEVVTMLSKKYDNLKIANDKKDASANNVIKKLQGQVNTQSEFIKQKDKDYIKMRGVADTCASALTAYEKYAKNLQPKNEITIAARTLLNYSPAIKPYFGLEIGWRTKKKWEFSVGYYSNQMFSAGIKKTILSF